MKLPEDPNRDFPFYQGNPVTLTTPHWCFLIALVGIAFALLIVPIPWPGGEFGAFIPALLFPVIPLLGLSWVSKGNAKSLFGRVGLREIKLMILFALLNIAVTLVVGGIVQVTLGANSNPAIAAASQLSPSGLTIFLSKTAVQLVGEEVLTIIPMLALMHWLVARTGMSRSRALFLSWIGTAVIFGLLHLSTYHWDFVQCVVIIGTARLMLSLAYIKTKNLWVSSGAHIINDWFLILINVLLSSLVQP
jgi:membrane protease YdiL (CAAX protease family)